MKGGLGPAGFGGFQPEHCAVAVALVVGYRGTAKIGSAIETSRCIHDQTGIRIRAVQAIVVGIAVRAEAIQDRLGPDSARLIRNQPEDGAASPALPIT